MGVAPSALACGSVMRCSFWMFISRISSCIRDAQRGMNIDGIHGVPSGTRSQPHLYTAALLRSKGLIAPTSPHLMAAAGTILYVSRTQRRSPTLPKGQRGSPISCRTWQFSGCGFSGLRVCVLRPSSRALTIGALKSIGCSLLGFCFTEPSFLREGVKVGLRVFHSLTYE